MILRAKRGAFPASKTPERFVVQIGMGQPGLILRKQIDIRNKAVVPECDPDPAALQIHDGMIIPVITKFDPGGLSAKRLAEHPVSGTDSEDRDLADQFLYSLNKTPHNRGIAGTVREGNPVRVRDRDLIRRVDSVVTDMRAGYKCQNRFFHDRFR